MNDPRPPGVRAAPVDAADVQARVASTIRADVRSLSAYHVSKADGLIKLDAMENPFALPGTLRERLARVLADVPVNRYPDGPGDAVKDALARSLPLPDGAALVLGNGSDELIQLLTTAIAAPGACVLAPEPSFVMYRLNAQYAKVRYVGVPLRPDFSLDAEAMLAAIARERPALVWLAYPNNPTGNRFARSTIERILGAAPGLVVVDEAYYAFADDSFLPRVLDFENLVVVRTVSKIGLAGLRLGYAAAHPAWIAEIDKVRPPYNVNALTQAALPVILAAADELARQATTIRAERERLAQALRGRRDVSVFPSETNFVLVRVPDAQAWFSSLLEAGILVKNLHGYHPLTSQCLRITVGTLAENDSLLAAIARCP
jgi:histidinol-phosphate aminotransferase